jgi:hypothetical protein
MLLRITNPDLVPDLLGYLRRGIDVVAAPVGADEVLVGLLGSRSEPSQRLELEARLVPWRSEHPQADVLLLADAA